MANRELGHPALLGLYPTPLNENRAPEAKQIPPNLFLSACHEKHNATNERHRAHDGRQRNVVTLFASSVNRSDVDDLFPSGIRKPTPRKTGQAKHYQNEAKRFAHGSPFGSDYI
jgi:hypothetical protein